MNASELIEELKRYDISAERKSIYDDIASLESFDVEIIKTKGSEGGYFIGTRQFETSEIKMLLDVIQASSFIPDNKSRALIDKLSAFAPVSARKQLRHQVFVDNRVKSDNKKVYYNIDALYQCIEQKTKAKFRYFSLDIEKNKKYHNGGSFYSVNPLALMWSDDRYYLVTFDDETKKTRHFRVDKMESVSLSDEPISESARAYLASFDAAEYAKRNFFMFAGEEREVTLRGSVDNVGLVYDRFGTGVFIVPDGKEHFTVSVRVALSPQFFSWIFGLEGMLKIVSPDDVVERYRNMCLSMAEL